MSVIAEVATDGRGFTVGRTLASPTGTTIEVERVVPMGDGAFPYCRVRTDDDPVAFERALASNAAVETVERLDDDDAAGQLYHVTWTPDAVDGILAAVRDNRGQILSAIARDDRWRFTLRFPASSQLAEFQRTTTAEDVYVDVERVYVSTDGAGDPNYGLTPAQLDALVTAVELGYFRVPRAISTADLGAILGISDQAVSERIRRGVEQLVRNAIGIHDDDR